MPTSAEPSFPSKGEGQESSWSFLIDNDNNMWCVCLRNELNQYLGIESKEREGNKDQIRDWWRGAANESLLIYAVPDWDRFFKWLMNNSLSGVRNNESALRTPSQTEESVYSSSGMYSEERLTFYSYSLVRFARLLLSSLNGIDWERVLADRRGKLESQEITAKKAEKRGILGEKVRYHIPRNLHFH